MSARAATGPVTGTTAASLLRPQGRRRGPMAVGLVLAVLGALAVALGITAATVWTHPSTAAYTAPLDGARVAVTVPGLMEAREGTVTVTATGTGEVMVATARSGDLEAWLGGDPPVRAATVGEAGLPPEGSVAVSGAEAASAAPAADPATSDLWLSRASGSGGAELDVPRRAGPVQVVASSADGSLEGLRMTWPSTAPSAAALPLLIGGGAVLVVGVALMALWRRGSSGTGAVPAVPPPAKEVPAKSAAKGSAAPSSRGGARARRAAVSFSAVGAIALAGCTSSSSLPPQPREQQGPQPALTAVQLQRVVEGAGGVLPVVDRADSDLDADVAAQRLGGSALEARTAAYTVAQAARTAEGGDPDSAPSVRALGGERLVEAVPAAGRWPRTVITVSDPATTTTEAGEEESAADGSEAGADAEAAPGAKGAPVLTVMTQQDPRAPYQVVARANLLPGATFPPLTQRDAAVQAVAAAADDASGLVSSPRQVLVDYADLLTKGLASDHYAGFQENAFTDTVIAEQEQQEEASGRFADFSVTHAVRPDALWALRTAEGGAVVVGVLDATRTLAATTEGVTLNASPEVAALGGAATATKQTVTTTETVVVTIPPASGARTPGAGADTRELTVVGAARDLTAVSLEQGAER